MRSARPCVNRPLPHIARETACGRDGHRGVNFGVGRMGIRFAGAGFLIADIFETAVSGGAQRYQCRRWTLSAEQVAVTQQSPRRSLRDLTAEHGVSPETIRAAKRSADVGAVG